MARRFQRERGQAAVEAALTLPLTLFLILGTIQLMMMMQGRAMAQYAVARSARAGSLKSGACRPMRDTAVAALLPTFVNVTTPAALAAAFNNRKSGKFFAAQDGGRNETMLWLERTTNPGGGLRDEEERFDLASTTPRTLIVRMTYFYPLRIPFVNWVISAMTLGHYGLQQPKGNPLMLPEKNPDWDDNKNVRPPIANELLARHKKAHYTMPIEVSYSMRMMTPARVQNLRVPLCQPYP